MFSISRARFVGVDRVQSLLGEKTTSQCIREKDYEQAHDLLQDAAERGNAERVFFLDISEHADGERRGPASI